MQTVKDDKASKQRLDYDWFLENLSSLYNEYGRAFLAIKDKKVLASYSTFEDAFKTTSENEPIGSFIIQECAASEEELTNYVMSFGLTVI